MFVWKNEAHKPLEIDEHNLTKLNQISTYGVYIFNTKKKKNNGQTWPALLSGNFLNHLPLISYILDLSDDTSSQYPGAWQDEVQLPELLTSNHGVSDYINIASMHEWTWVMW